MARLGIETGADLRAQSLAFLTHNFGSSGEYYYNLARGICHRQVKPDRPYKSIGAEDTFFDDLTDEEALAAELDRISQTVWRRIAEKEITGRTVTLKVKYQDFQIVTRARSLDRAVAGREEFLEIGCALLRTLLPPPKGIRLLGLTLSNLSEGAEAEAARELELPLQSPDMCNLYRLDTRPDAVADCSQAIGLALRFPEGIPNFEPREIRITDRAPIVRAGCRSGRVELVERRWSWPGADRQAGLQFPLRGPRPRRAAAA